MSVDLRRGLVAAPARNRVRVATGSCRTTVRLTAGELRAAAWAALTPTGYTGEAWSLLPAPVSRRRGTGASRAELARVQRDLFAARTCVADALAAVQGGQAGYDGASCTAAVARLHGHLRRAAA